MFNFFFNNYTLSNLSHSFTFSSPQSPLPSTLILLYIFPFIFLYFVSSSFPLLPFHLPTTLNLNITIHLFLHLSLFCLFIFTSSYYKFVILFSILCIIFPHKKVYLSLSLSLSHNIFWSIFFFLHLYFKLINFCVCYNSTLG